MFLFEPTKLEETGKKIREQHPSLHDIPLLQDVAGTKVGNGLIKKLLALSEQDIPDFVTRLKRRERHYLPELITYNDELVRIRVVQCMHHDISLVRLQSMWMAVEGYYLEEGVLHIARLVLSNDSLRQGFNEYQLAVFNARASDDPEDFAMFWSKVESRRLSRKTYLAEAKLLYRSALLSLLDTYLILHTSERIWSLHRSDELAGIFDRFDTDNKLNFFECAAENFGFDVSAGKRALTYLMGTFERLLLDPNLMVRLQRVSHRTAEWCSGVLEEVKFKYFFRINGDERRYKFWEMNRAYFKPDDIDTINNRLFMNFGHFGIIEFGEKGNASYVYERPYYDELLAKNKKFDISSHDEFKDKQQCIRTLEHRGNNWEGGFQEKLTELLARYNVE